mmetsp:Transcript_13777/g.22482  ORF Transcript_13777/g.22482 Transcript_13777/m.22482 type:complete len:171 (-) Transcript_13777:658-1170(-)
MVNIAQGLLSTALFGSSIWTTAGGWTGIVNIHSSVGDTVRLDCSSNPTELQTKAPYGCKDSKHCPYDLTYNWNGNVFMEESKFQVAFVTTKGNGMKIQCKTEKGMTLGKAELITVTNYNGVSPCSSSRQILICPNGMQKTTAPKCTHKGNDVWEFEYKFDPLDMCKSSLR